jgi:hypothetical protein
VSPTSLEIDLLVSNLLSDLESPVFSPKKRVKFEVPLVYLEMGQRKDWLVEMMSLSEAYRTVQGEREVRERGSCDSLK